MNTGENQLNKLQSLYSLSYTLAQPLAPDEFLKQALEKLCEATRADIGLIYVLDMDEKALILRSFFGVRSDAVLRRISSLKYSKADFLRVPRWKLADMSIADLFGESTLNNLAGQMRDEQVKSICASVFSGRSRLIGVAVLAGRQQQFDKHDYILLRAVAAQTGLVLENIALLEKVKDLETVDRNSGFYNSRYFQQRLGEEVLRASRYGLNLSVLSLNIDNAKRHLTCLGDKAEKELIKTMSYVIRDSIRKTDLSCSYNRTNFLILLTHTNLPGAVVVADRIRKRMKDALGLQSRSCHMTLTASLGIACFPTDSAMDDRLTDLAQLALNKAIHDGGNCICLARDIQAPPISAETDISNTLQHIIQQINAENIYRFAASIDKRSGGQHSQEVAAVAIAIGKSLNMTQYNIEKLRKAALLHDLGKIAIPQGLLNSSGLEQSEVFLKHPELGAAIVRQIPELAVCAPAIKHHHERHDGSGFPEKLSGEQIPLEARVISVAEVFTYLTRRTDNGTPLTTEQAISELRSKTGKFDPAVLIALEKAFGSLLASPLT